MHLFNAQLWRLLLLLLSSAVFHPGVCLCVCVWDREDGLISDYWPAQEMKADDSEWSPCECILCVCVIDKPMRLTPSIFKKH